MSSIYSYILGTLRATFSIGKNSPATIDASGLTAPRTYTLPDKGGPLVVASDIPPSSVVITTSTTINIPEDYPTVNAALDYLSSVRINWDAYITVKVNQPNNLLIEISNYNLPNVSIVGTTGTPLLAYTNQSDSVSISGTSGNYTAVFSFPWGHQINIGDVVYTRANMFSGTGLARALLGCYKVSAITSTTITVPIKYRRDTFPSTSISYAWFSRITSAGKLSAMTIRNCVLSRIANFLTEKIDIVDSHIRTLEDINITECSIVGGVSISRSTIEWINNFNYTNNSTGITIKNSNIGGFIVSHTANSSGISLFNSNVTVDNTTGYPLNIYGNASEGLRLEDSRLISGDSSNTNSDQVMAVRDNTGADIRAIGDSYVYCKGMSQTSVTFNPAINTLGNGKSVIRTL